MLNMGIVYNQIGDFQRAYECLIDAYNYFEKENHACIEKTLFNLAHVQDYNTHQSGKLPSTDQILLYILSYPFL